MARKQKKERACPFKVVIDSNEGAPAYRFDNLKDRDGRLWKVETAKQALWATGVKTYEIKGTLHRVGLADYSIVGYEELFQVERKTLSDLYGSLGNSRNRMEARIARLNECEIAYLMIEASWKTIMAGYEFSEVHPNSIEGALLAWSHRYPRVHVMTATDAIHAERITFNLMRHFWRSKQRRVGEML